MCDACNKANAINFQIESPWLGLSEIQQKRISTLEGLLRQVLNHKDSGFETDSDGQSWPLCFDCGSVEIQAMDGKLRHKSDCLFTRIQKELGEG